jgi:hypothetical protein
MSAMVRNVQLRKMRLEFVHVKSQLMGKKRIWVKEETRGKLRTSIRMFNVLAYPLVLCFILEQDQPVLGAAGSENCQLRQTNLE